MKLKFSNGKLLIICDKCRCINRDDRRNVCAKCRKKARQAMWGRVLFPIWDMLPRETIGDVLYWLTDSPEMVFYKGGIKCLFHRTWCNDGYFDSYKRIKVGGIPQETYGIDRWWYPHDCSGQTFCSHVDTYLFGFISVGHYAVDI